MINNPTATVQTLAPVDDTVLDATIDALDRVMNGCEPSDEVPPFIAERQLEMRVILRKLIARELTRAKVLQ